MAGNTKHTFPGANYQF